MGSGRDRRGPWCSPGCRWTAWLPLPSPLCRWFGAVCAGRLMVGPSRGLVGVVRGDESILNTSPSRGSSHRRARFPCPLIVCLDVQSTAVCVRHHLQTAGRLSASSLVARGLALGMALGVGWVSNELWSLDEGWWCGAMNGEVGEVVVNGKIHSRGTQNIHGQGFFFWESRRASPAIVAPMSRAHHAENTALTRRAWPGPRRSGHWGPNLGGTLVRGGRAPSLTGHSPTHLPQTSTSCNSQRPGFLPRPRPPRRRNEGRRPPEAAPSEASSAGAAELAFFHESRQSTTATGRSEHDDGCHRQWRERVGSAPSDAVTLAGATMEIATPRTRSRRPGQTTL